MAIAGHPDVSDTYLGRHNNNTPERYSASANHWTLLEDGHTAPEAATPTPTRAIISCRRPAVLRYVRR